jgi:hypothetical protein
MLNVGMEHCLRMVVLGRLVIDGKLLLFDEDIREAYT